MGGASVLSRNLPGAASSAITSEMIYSFQHRTTGITWKLVNFHSLMTVNDYELTLDQHTHWRYLVFLNITSSDIKRCSWYLTFVDINNIPYSMMTSLNGNIFRVTGPLWGESGEFPSQRPVTRSFDVFFDEMLLIWDVIVLIMTSP